MKNNNSNLKTTKRNLFLDTIVMGISISIIYYKLSLTGAEKVSTSTSIMLHLILILPAIWIIYQLYELCKRLIKAKQQRETSNQTEQLTEGNWRTQQGY